MGPGLVLMQAQIQAKQCEKCGRFIAILNKPEKMATDRDVPWLVTPIVCSECCRPFKRKKKE